LPKVFGHSAVRFGSLSVLDAFASPEALDKAVRVVVEADMVVFDVTRFEPGVMLLVGIRSASDRSAFVAMARDGKRGNRLRFRLISRTSI